MSLYYPSSSRFWPGFVPNVTCGVVGGIPDRSGGTEWDVTTFGAGEAESAATNTTAFNDALAASAEGDIIVWPAGNFDIVSLNIPHQFSNRTVRGAGMALTILHPTGSPGAHIGDNGNFGNPFNPQSTITAMTANSAVITVADGSVFPTPVSEDQHRVARIHLVNEAVTPIVATGNQPFIRSFTVVMIARIGNNITLSQPLPSNFAAGATGAVLELGFQIPRFNTGIGLEDMEINGDSTLMSVGVFVDFASNCWCLNVKVRNHNNYGIQLYDSVNIEIRRCWIDESGDGSNHSGLLYNSGSYGLVEDNIVVNNSPGFEINASSTANVFAYNYLGNGVLNCNHGPWNSFNLYEGNIFWFIQTDGYFGGSSQETDYRNWMRSGLITNQKRFSRERNIVGNIVGIIGESYLTDGSELWGDPNIGNNNSIGTAEPSTGNWWPDWDVGLGQVKAWPGELTTRTTDNSGVITLDTGLGSDFAAALSVSANNVRGVQPSVGQPLTVTVLSVVGDVVTFAASNVPLPAQGDVLSMFPSYDGFQQKDLDVANSTSRLENYYVITGDIPSGENIAPDTLPDSYFRTSEPAYFTGFVWPPFDPLNPGATAIENLPAGARFLAEEPLSPPVSGSMIISGSPVVGQTLTMIGGLATGNPVPTYTYQWTRDGMDIPGATSPTYLLVNDDIGTTVAGKKTATNGEAPDSVAEASAGVIADYTGDILVLNEIANAQPVTELLRYCELDSNGDPLGPIQDVIIHHSGNVPTQPVNNRAYAQVGGGYTSLTVLGTQSLPQMQAWRNANYPL